MIAKILSITDHRAFSMLPEQFLQDSRLSLLHINAIPDDDISEWLKRFAVPPRALAVENISEMPGLSQLVGSGTF